MSTHEPTLSRIEEILSSSRFERKLMLDQNQVVDLLRRQQKKEKKPFYQCILPFLGPKKEKKFKLRYKSFAKEVEINPLIEDCQWVGAIEPSLREETDKHLFSLDEKTRRDLNYLHVKCIKVQFKSRFPTDIDCPIRIGFIDRRFNNPSDALLGAAETNLGLATFTICFKPGFPCSLHDRWLDSIYTIGYQIFRGEFMKKENSSFSIRYTVEYALVPSKQLFGLPHHFPSIEVDDIYSKYFEVRRREEIEISHIPKIWTDLTEVDSV